MNKFKIFISFIIGGSTLFIFSILEKMGSIAAAETAVNQLKDSSDSYVESLLLMDVFYRSPFLVLLFGVFLLSCLWSKEIKSLFKEKSNEI